MLNVKRFPLWGPRLDGVQAMLKALLAVCIILWVAAYVM